MKMRAVYPGTFDPITFGHIDVIKRGAKLFDHLVVAVASNPLKEPFFSTEERVEMVEHSVKGMQNVEVKTFGSLLVDFAKKEKAGVVIRGLREMSDFPGEFQQALVNRKLSPHLETVFVVTSSEFFYLSSSVVKELSRFGGNVADFVPRHVEKKLDELAKKNA